MNAHHDQHSPENTELGDEHEMKMYQRNTQKKRARLENITKTNMSQHTCAPGTTSGGGKNPPPSPLEIPHPPFPFLICARV